VPMYGYSGMKVKVNGQQVQYETDADLGRIIISLPQGQSSVSVKLHKTLVRHASDFISLITLLVLLKLIFKKK